MAKTYSILRLVQSDFYYNNFAYKLRYLEVKIQHQNLCGKDIDIIGCRVEALSVTKKVLTFFMKFDLGAFV